VLAVLGQINKEMELAQLNPLVLLMYDNSKIKIKKQIGKSISSVSVRKT
jgi:hypothetical protein